MKSRHDTQPRYGAKSRTGLIGTVFFIAAMLAIAQTAYAQQLPMDQASPLSDYRLIGTMEGTFAGAVMDDASGVQTFYRLYGKLPNGSQIVKVLPDSIILKQSDGSSFEMFASRATKPGTPTRPPVNVSAVAPAAPPATPEPSQAPEQQKRSRVRHIRDYQNHDD